MIRTFDAYIDSSGKAWEDDHHLNEDAALISHYGRTAQLYTVPEGQAIKVIGRSGKYSSPTVRHARSAKLSKENHAAVIRAAISELA